MDDSIQLRCPAKLNLSLSVGAPAANGLHPIASWMVAVELFDDLEVRKLPAGTPSAYSIAFEASAPRAETVDWPLEKDLAVRAHRMLEASVGRALPLALSLRKRIPTGAGMGGGSSNAAGMLRAVNDLYELGHDRASLAAMAVQLGSDIPFFLGEPSAIVSGFGEKCEAAPLEKAIWLVLIFPELHCDTGAVYRAFDRLRPDAVVRVIEPARKLEAVLINDLADAACEQQPELGQVREQCSAAAGCSVHVTGSGAGLYTLHRDARSAADTAARIRSRAEVAVAVSRTVAGIVEPVA